MTGPTDKSRVWSPQGGGARSHVIAPFSEIELVPTVLHVHPPLDDDLPPTVLALATPARDARTARTELIIAVTGELFDHAFVTPSTHQRRATTRTGPQSARSEPRRAVVPAPLPDPPAQQPVALDALAPLRKALAIVPVPALLALLCLGLLTGVIGGALLALWLTR